MTPIELAKQRLPLPNLLESLGLGEHAKKSARCPFHDDHDNSFSVYKNDKGQWRFKCFTGCGSGDEITFVELHKRISNGEAIKLFLEMAGLNASAPLVRKPDSPPATPRPNETRPGNAFDWRACAEAFTDKHVELPLSSVICSSCNLAR